MTSGEEIGLKADAVRAPCIAYWLLVFACLMMQLFPVHQHAGQWGFKNHSVIEAAGGDEWVPPAGVVEVPILAAAGVELPENAPAVFEPLPCRARAAFAIRTFEARGPPASI